MRKHVIFRLLWTRRAVHQLLFTCLALCLTGTAARGQNWVWKTETVDKSGQTPSIAADPQGNLHITYINENGVMYGFRPAESPKWFTLPIGAKAENAYASVTTDAQGNPRICFTAYEQLHYASFKDGHWNIQPVGENLGAIEYTCSMAIGPDGTPRMIWYQYMDPSRSLYLHLRFATEREGAWMAQTLDFDGETGKWNSLVLDRQGNPHISYSAWTNGDLKYAYWNGKSWQVLVVDARDLSQATFGRGMGNSLVLTPDGTALISYFQDQNLKLARQTGDTWKREIVDSISPIASTGWEGSRTSLMLDKSGNPHIIYGDYGRLKHAYWDGKRWRIQVIESGAGGQFKQTIAILGRDDTIYVAYADPSDASVKVMIGSLISPRQTAATKKDVGK
jgi:hypothetical protein